MNNMVKHLKEAQAETNSMVILGLDFDIKKIPKWFAKKYSALPIDCIFEFNKAIIDKAAPFVCGFKPNLAFYELPETFGQKALRETVEYILEKYPKHLIILDGKRGDIGNTATKYAESLVEIGGHATTVNPYLGPKTLQSFLDKGLGIFALCVTSNPDAAIMQNVKVTGIDGVERESMFSYIAEVLTKGVQSNEKDKKVAKIHSFTPPDNWQGQIGLVTGATHPNELAKVREMVGNNVVLLIPGIGKQDGDLEATIRSNGKNGLAVVNTSRGALYASKGKDFATKAAEVLKKLRDDINAIKNKMKG